MKSVISMLVLIMLLVLCQCNSNTGSSQDTLEKVQQEKKIRVGYITYFDITYRNGNTGETNGFLVDVLTEALKDLHIPKENIEFVETDWANFGLGLQTGKYELSIAGTFNTEVRARVVKFSDPIFYLGNGAVVRKDENRFHTIDDFNQAGVTIAVVQGEQGYEYAKKHLTKAAITALSGSDLSIAPLEVKLGKADAALSDQYILRRYCEKNPEVKDALKDSPYDILPICWSVSKDKKDSTLLNYVNQKLSTMKKTGKLQELQDKYPMIPFAKPPSQ